MKVSTLLGAALTWFVLAGCDEDPGGSAGASWGPAAGTGGLVGGGAGRGGGAAGAAGMAGMGAGGAGIRGGSGGAGMSLPCGIASPSTGTIKGTIRLTNPV